MLHSCANLGLDKTQRTLQDTDLLATIADGDLIGIEAMYHKQCMDAFLFWYRCYKRSLATLSDSTDQSLTDSRVFAEIISFIEANVEEGEYICSLTDLLKIYASRLSSRGYEKQMNKSRLKKKLLDHY